MRDADGQCRDPTDCSAQCDGGEGEVQVGFGICQCNDLVKVEEICKQDCQEKLITKTFK